MSCQDALPRSLLNLSFLTRLSIAIGSVVVFLVVYMILPTQYSNPIIFAVPIVLCGWMFRKSGVILCLIFLVVTLWLYLANRYETLLLPLHLTIYFFIGTFALLFIGLLVSAQRDAFDMVDEAQEQLYIAYEQQRKVDQIKDQFLQNVNHELRTPLTAIYGYLELLSEHNDRLDASMRKTFLDHAMQSCDELQLLVNNVLDSMSEGSDVKKKQEIYMTESPVRDVVHEVLERFDPKTLRSHKIFVEVPPYIVVMANPQYVRQVLRNLLSNAFKYAAGGTPIHISAELHGKTVDPYHPSPQICISVQDAGPGIPPEEIKLLFGQFVRLRRDTSGNVRGSGLGLFLSKQFVEMMGGRIWVESDGIDGHGSRFSFTLPCVPRPTVTAQTPAYCTYSPEEPSDVEV